MESAGKMFLRHANPLVFYLPKVDLVKVNISTNINVVLHEPSISGGEGEEEGGGRPRQCFVISLN